MKTGRFAKQYLEDKGTRFLKIVMAFKPKWRGAIIYYRRNSNHMQGGYSDLSPANHV
jgi:hypothetical protein